MADKIIHVSPWHVRRLFNHSGFVAKVQSGELIEECIKKKHLTKDKAAEQQQEYCTHSRTSEYLRNTTRVAIIHQYEPPAGDRSRPDPKYIEIDGRLYAPWPKKNGLAGLYYWALGWVTGIRYKIFG
jgi:hypothetical protein